MFRYIYIGVCVIGLGFCAGHSLMGYEYFSKERRTTLSESARQSPGGYRSFYFWHTGYRGGK